MQKIEKIVENWKVEAITAKHHKNRREINQSSKEQKNNKSDTTDDMNLNQAKDKCPVPS